MKICVVCKSDKNPFGKNRSRYDGLQSRCMPCDRERGKRYYHDSPGQQVACRERSKKHQKNNQDLVCQYLSTHPCPCGEADIVVLDFDHTDPTTKLDNVSTLIGTKGISWERIKAEIDKCVVRCANCHRRKTANELGNYRLNWIANNSTMS